MLLGKKTSLYCLWPQPELGRVWKTAATVQSKPSHVTNLERQRPQHMTQTGTTACTCDPGQAELDKRVGKILKKPLWPGTAALRPLCHMARLLWPRVTWRLSGFHPDSRISTWGFSVLGIIHRKPRRRQHSLKLLCLRAGRQINLMKFVCLVSFSLCFMQGRWRGNNTRWG